MTFSPTDCTRYTDPKRASLDSSGTFQLTDDDADTARIVMGADYVRRYAAIAQLIHTEEEEGSYRDDRTMMNLQDAFRACAWLEDNLPQTIALESDTLAPVENMNGEVLYID